VLISAIFWIGEQWLSQTFNQAFASAPWSWLLFSSSTLLIGVVYADVLNESSCLRATARKIARIIEVDGFVLAHRVEDGRCWYEAVIHSRFLKAHKKVNCSIQVTQFVGLKHAEKRFVTWQGHVSNTEENLRKMFVVATFPQRVSKEHPGNPYWGSEPNQTWVGDGNHVVTLRLSTLFRRQTEKFLVSAIRDVGEGPEPVILFGGPRDDKFIQISEQT
jgi:hypothetical protein